LGRFLEKHGPLTPDPSPPGGEGSLLEQTLKARTTCTASGIQPTEVRFDHAPRLPNGNDAIRGNAANGKVREVERSPSARSSRSNDGGCRGNRAGRRPCRQRPAHENSRLLRATVLAAFLHGAWLLPRQLRLGLATEHVDLHE